MSERRPETVADSDAFAHPVERELAGLFDEHAIALLAHAGSSTDWPRWSSRRRPDVSTGVGAGIEHAMAEPASELDGVEFRMEEEYPRPGAVVLALNGEADLHAAPELRDRVDTAIADGATVLVVDLSDTTFVDSMTLGVLLGAMKRLRGRGGQLQLVVTRPDLRRIFEITLLDRVFPIHASREEALAAAVAGNGA